MTPDARWRSALFAPATRPELAPKLAASGADLVILDLEDAVLPTRKSDARALAHDSARGLLDKPDGPTVAIRVNGPETPWFDDDIALALPAGLEVVVVPKLETTEQATRVVALLDNAGFHDTVILAGLETALGVADARLVMADDRIVACYFGAEDLVADLGGIRTTEGSEVAHARAHVALSARVANATALDIAVVDTGDHATFIAQARDARAMGYAGKLCIHPSQVVLANAAFTPTPDEVALAEQIVAAAEEAATTGNGIAVVNGQMIDTPLVIRARQVLAQPRTLQSDS